MRECLAAAAGPSGPERAGDRTSIPHRQGDGPSRDSTSTATRHAPAIHLCSRNPGARRHGLAEPSRGRVPVPGRASPSCGRRDPTARSDASRLGGAGRLVGVTGRPGARRRPGDLVASAPADPQSGSPGSASRPRRNRRWHHVDRRPDRPTRPYRPEPVDGDGGRHLRRGERSAHSGVAPAARRHEIPAPPPAPVERGDPGRGGAPGGRRRAALDGEASAPPPHPRRRCGRARS